MGAITCTHISLSPDKWEKVEINLRKIIEGGKAKVRTISLPRLRKCGHKTFNAFTHGRFSKTYIKYAAAEVIREIYGDAAEKAVQDVRAAYSALEAQWKDGTIYVLASTLSRCERIRWKVTRVALLSDKIPDLQDALSLYDSVRFRLESF